MDQGSVLRHSYVRSKVLYCVARVSEQDNAGHLAVTRGSPPKKLCSIAIDPGGGITQWRESKSGTRRPTNAPEPRGLRYRASARSPVSTIFVRMYMFPLGGDPPLVYHQEPP